MSALGVVALVLGILAFVALAVALISIPARRHSRRVEAELVQELGPSVRRVETVGGLGLMSLGRTQIRGNGTLALTADELRFQQWVPRRVVRIPLDRVTEVTTERWWLGKTVGRRLLCVRWQTDAGGADAMAWQVRDLDAWLADLRA